MINVTFIDHHGTRRGVTAPAGLSVMAAAIDNDVPGIDADCGGACACATCHVYIDPAWAERVGRPGDDELGMLELAADVRSNSRLACQVRLSESLDGLVVTTPETQQG